jgi:hypothetical protein
MTEEVGKKDNTEVGVFADAKDFSTSATPSVEMTEEVGKKDNTEVGVFASQKISRLTLEMTREGRLKRT